MGTGKTAQASCAAAVVCNKLTTWSVYVITTKLNLLTWKTEIEKWVPGAQVYLHAGSSRLPTREIPRRYHFVVTNYGLEHELPPGCSVLIIDESHKGKNHRTQRFKHLRRLSKAALWVWLATGTVVRNHPADLIPQAMLCGIVSSFWSTVERWFATCAAEYGSSQEIGSVKDVDGFKAWASTFMLRRTKKQALPDLPAKTRKKLLVELSASQRKVYEELRKELAAVVEGESGEELIVTPTKLALTTRLRQLLVTPKLLGAKEQGSALKAVSLWVIDVVTEEKQKGVIFTPFREAIPHIIEASGLKPDEVSVFVGGMSVKQMAAAKERFDGDHGKLAICTIQVSEGFSLTGASRALFVGADWTMAANEQAEDRLHRFGQDNAVVVDYITHLGTVDEDLYALLDQKNTGASMFDTLRGQ